MVQDKRLGLTGEKAEIVVIVAAVYCDEAVMLSFHDSDDHGGHGWRIVVVDVSDLTSLVV